MNVGDIVKSKKEQIYGTVEYSTFGFSIHIWNEELNILGKTLGMSAEEVNQFWEVVSLPEGYEKHPYGGIRKKEDK